MKKPNQSTLFIIAGILFLISAVMGDDTNYAIATIGFALITIGLSKRKKQSDSEDSEENELLIEEEKQVWEEFKGKVEADEDGTSFKFGVVSRYPI